MIYFEADYSACLKLLSCLALVNWYDLSNNIMKIKASQSENKFQCEILIKVFCIIIVREI